MLSQLSPRERLGYASVVGLLLFGFGYVGAQHLRRPAPLVFESAPPAQSQTAPVTEGSAQSISTPAEAAPSREVIVHVAGAVKNPGVVRLTTESRVIDAVEAAGGPTEKASLDSVNLAAKLVDGTQLHIPTKQEAKDQGTVVASAAPAPIPAAEAEPGYYAPEPVASPAYIAPPASSGPRSTTTPSTKNAVVNINTADEAELDKLPGVGPVTAQKILAYRQQNGPFRSVDELLAVKGIGPKKLEDMRPFVRL